MNACRALVSLYSTTLYVRASVPCEDDTSWPQMLAWRRGPIEVGKGLTLRPLFQNIQARGTTVLAAKATLVH